MIRRAHHSWWPLAGLVSALALANVQRADVQSQLTGTVETVSTSGTTYDFPAVSADGRHVAFISDQQLDPLHPVPSSFHIWVRDRQLGTTVLVSKSSTGVPANDRSLRPAISADGRFIAFSSSATNLVPGDTNNVDDIFVHDRDADGNGIFDEPGESPIVRVSVSTTGVQGNCVSARPTISGTGRYIAFDSCATNWPEVAGKTFAVQDVFVHDRATGITTWVNPPTQAAPNGFNNHHSAYASISGDGRYVAFGSQATTQPQNIGHFGSSEIYVRDTCAGGPIGCAPATQWANPQPFVEGEPSDAFSPQISADGQFVAYESRSTLLVPGDTNGAVDIFVFNRRTSGITRVNVSGAGLQALTTGPTTCSGSLHASISGDGRLVTFESCANNLVSDDTIQPNFQDVFVHDRDADHDGVLDEPGGISTALISRNPQGVTADSSSLMPTISRDGQVVVFSSFSRDITPTASPIGIFAWTAANASPVANAGADQTVDLVDPIGRVVTLDGSASHDPDGDPLSFTWTGPFGTMTGAVISPTVPEGVHTITLTVSDGHGGTATDTVTVTVKAIDGPVVIEIAEAIAVLDAPDVRPSALLAVSETIAVLDAPIVQPSALVGVAESIVVMDGPAILPSPLLTVTENVTVNDAPELVPSGNTPAGTNVVVTPLDVAGNSAPVRLKFSTVTQAGNTTVASGAPGPPPPPGFEYGTAPRYYDLGTTAGFSGNVEVCIAYGATTFGGAPTLWHFDNGAWVNITVSHDPALKVVCGLTPSLSPFAIFSPVVVSDTTPPVLRLPSNIVTAATSGAGAIVNYSASATDLVDGAVTAVCSPGSGAAFRLGVTPVNCSATDAHGNTARGSFAVNVKLGVPLVTVDVSASGRDQAGRFYVDVVLRNLGSGHARNVRLSALTFLTVSGSGSVSYNAALSGPLPLGIGSLDAGAAAAPRRLYLNVPARVGRFSILEGGTLENVTGTRLPFIGIHIITVPR